ncbi:TPA: phage tail tape measure protein [Vibrio harveyi]
MKNNYALGLVVGIQNQFTKGAKEIQDEYKKLTTEHNKLQTKVKDVEAYKKAQAELKNYKAELQAMGSPSEDASAKLQKMTNELSRQSRALKKAGVDTNDLAASQNKLQNELGQTARQIQSMGNVEMMSAESLAGYGVSGATVVAGAQSGMNTNRIERQAAASTDMSLETIQSWRNELADIETETARPYQEILQTRIQASKSGYDDKTALELTRTASQLSTAFSDLNWQPQDIIAAQTRMMKSFDISAQEASDLIAVTARKTGDDKGDLLDTLSEYSSTFADKGLDAKTVVAQLVAGRQAGVWNYDKIGDQLKETLNARLSDPDEFKKLVGDGTKAGNVDTLIKDPEQAAAFKSALFEMRNAVKTGEGTGSAYANMMMQLSSFQETDKGAARNLAEGVGGTILAEDIGARGIKAIAEASNDPLAVLGEYEGTLADAMEVVISPTQRLTSEILALGRAVSTVWTDIENGMGGMFDSVSDGISSIREAANDNVLVSGALTAGAAATSAYGAYSALKRGKFIKDKMKEFTSGRVSGDIGKPLKNHKPHIPDIPDINVRPKNTPPAPKISPSYPGKLKTLMAGIEDSVGSNKLKGILSGITDKLSFQNLGKVFKPLALVAGAAPLAKSVYDGDYKEAGKLAGSLGGGIAGAKLGAIAGTLGGPIGIGVGGVAGGIIGSIFGEQAIEEIMDFFAPDTIKEIETVTEQVQEMDNSVSNTQVSTNAPIQLAISAPITIESGAIVPEDFQHQLITAFRNITPELSIQLKEAFGELVI